MAVLGELMKIFCKKNISYILFYLFFFPFFFFTSCQLFENDVNDFFEKYTETAAIETHVISEQPYFDALGNQCISSKKDVEISLYMRNPKNFTMNPIINFTNLPESIDLSSVQISQTSYDTIQLLLPQAFLLATDQGKDLSSSISLYEPMSGRYFTGYTINLKCNTIPPLVKNPTIFNFNGQSFVIAFDMPDAEELSLRHKDIVSIRINDIDYELSIADDGAFTFQDQNFSLTPINNLIIINDKTFTNTSRSVYFQTNEAFKEGDKTYKISLLDSAGLYQTIYSSTSISRISQPVIKDADNFAYPSGFNETVSGSNSDPFRIIIDPPLTDHKGNSIDSTELHYSLYRGTSSVAAVIQEGISNSSITLDLEPGTYYIEAYATKTNYEQSPITTAKFRVIDNAIYISQTGDDLTADGTSLLPFATLNAAIADIDVRNMANAHLTIYIDGTIDGIGTVNATQTRSITFTNKNDGAPAILNGNNSGPVLTIDTTVPVKLKKIKITGGNATNGGGIHIKSGSSLALTNGVTITGNSASQFGGAIYCEGNLSISGVNNITENHNAAGGSSNIYLPAGKTIKITGALSSNGTNSRIGITTATAPTILTAVPFTTDYGFTAGGFNEGIHPGNYFISDNYSINKDATTGEATIFLNSGTFSQLLDSLNMTFSIDRSSFNTGTETTVTVTPTITAAGAPVNYSDIADNVTWLVKLKNGGVDVPFVSSNTNILTIPATVTSPDNYKIYIQAVCYGIYVFDTELSITGN